MGEDAERVLKSMVGKDVNIYQVGLCTSFREYKSFDYFVEPMYNGQEYLVFTSSDSEVRFSILIDEIYDIKVDAIKQEIIFTLHCCGQLQVWVDVA